MLSRIEKETEKAQQRVINQSNLQNQIDASEELFLGLTGISQSDFFTRLSNAHNDINNGIASMQAITQAFLITPFDSEHLVKIYQSEYPENDFLTSSIIPSSTTPLSLLEASQYLHTVSAGSLSPDNIETFNSRINQWSDNLSKINNEQEELEEKLKQLTTTFQRIIGISEDAFSERIKTAHDLVSRNNPRKALDTAFADSFIKVDLKHLVRDYQDRYPAGISTTTTKRDGLINRALYQANKK